MSVVLLLASAYATPPGPGAFGFRVTSRDDVPTDARIPFDANYDLPAEISAGPGAPQALAVEVLPLSGYSSFVVITSPHGWDAGEAFTVTATADPYGYGADETFELSFVAGAGPAADPVAPEVLSIDYGDWSAEETRYTSGCCKRVRTVTVTFRTDDADPWSFVELHGRRTGRQASRLAVVVGADGDTFRYEQWDDGGTAEPAELFLVGVAADGDASAEVPLDLSGAPPPAGAEDDTGTTSTGGGCSTTGAGGWALSLTLLAARRRVRT